MAWVTIANVRGPQGLVGPAGDTRWSKARLYGSSLIDSFITQETEGAYPVPTLAVAQDLGLPSPGTGTLTALRMGSGDSATQVWHNQGLNHIYTRTHANGTWSAWAPGNFMRGALAGPDNVSTFQDANYAGLWRRSYTSTQGFPNNDLGVILVMPSTYGCTQLFFSHSSAAAMYMRTIVFGSSWQQWAKVGQGGSSTASTQEVGLTNQLLKEDFSRRHGGRIRTGGKGVVAFRFDHGLTNFASIVMPMLLARGIVGSQAMNSRTWDTPENSGATPAMVDAWVAAGNLEIWNHGATHEDPMNLVELEDEVITSLAELRAQLPSAQIDGWITPGVQSTGEAFLGMGNVTSVERLYNSVAGRMFLSHHAVINGHVTDSVYRPLDGEIRQGQTYSTIDKLALATFQAQVDQAAATRKGIGFMLHPLYIGREGYVTAATFEAMLDYAVAKQAAGDIVILSPYQLMLADSTQ